LNIITKETLNQSIATDQQVKEFIDRVYVVDNITDKNLYSRSFVSLNDVFGNVVRHSVNYENKTVKGFGSFCGKTGVSFLRAKEVGMNEKTGAPYASRRYRQIYVLKPVYYGKIKVYAPVDLQDGERGLCDKSAHANGSLISIGVTITDIVDRQRVYQKYLKEAKEQGVTIIGYARKSIGSEPLCERNRLLQKMVDNLSVVSTLNSFLLRPARLVRQYQSL
jgi:hypothetical protein